MHRSSPVRVDRRPRAPSDHAVAVVGVQDRDAVARPVTEVDRALVDWVTTLGDRRRHADRRSELQRQPVVLGQQVEREDRVVVARHEPRADVAEQVRHRGGPGVDDGVDEQWTGRSAASQDRCTASAVTALMAPNIRLLRIFTTDPAPTSPTRMTWRATVDSSSGATPSIVALGTADHQRPGPRNPAGRPRTGESRYVTPILGQVAATARAVRDRSSTGRPRWCRPRPSAERPSARARTCSGRGTDTSTTCAPSRAASAASTTRTPSPAAGPDLRHRVEAHDVVPGGRGGRGGASAHGAEAQHRHPHPFLRLIVGGHVPPPPGRASRAMTASRCSRRRRWRSGSATGAAPSSVRV